MKCPTCTAEIDDMSTTCVSCGSPVISLQTILDEQVKEGSINCEICGNKVDYSQTYIWMGGKIAGVKNQRYSTTVKVITTYNNIIPIPIGICQDCYQKQLKKKKIVTYIVLSITVLIPLTAFVIWAQDHSYDFCAGLSLLAVFFFLPALDVLKVYLGKDKNKILEGLTTPYSFKKKKSLSLDIVWKQADYSKLIGKNTIYKH
jgi:hypothetical protein